MTRWFGLVAGGMLAVSAYAQDSKPAGDKPAAGGGTAPTGAAPAAGGAATGDATLNPKVELTTSLGKIVIELNGEKAPISVDNFVTYVEAKFYDGTIFHRVMPTFMIQGGGYSPTLDEKKDGLRAPIKNEWKNGLKNNRGTIAMARTAAPDTATAQFFINVVDNSKLDEPISGGAGYCVFGRVIDGMDVVDKIKETPTKEDAKLPMGKVVPETPVVITSAKMLSKFDKAKLADAMKKAEDEAKAAQDKAKADQEAAIQTKVAEIEKEVGKKMEKTASGLMWVTMKDGAGDSPKPTSTVKVHYTGWLTNGKKFDSSVDRGQPAEFPLSGVIKGWTEGVGMMKVGEKRKLLIPPDLGYGARGAGRDIPPNSWLVFDVELLEIK